MRAALSAWQYAGPDAYGFYKVQVGVGHDIEFSAKGLEGVGDFTGRAFHLRGLSRSVAECIWEIAKAADMVPLPAMAVPWRLFLLQSKGYTCQLISAVTLGTSWSSIPLLNSKAFFR